MPKLVRDFFYGGLAIALIAGTFLLWLWQPQRQVQRHSENLLHAFERKDWPRVADFVAPDYQDQWHNDRALLLERSREVFRYLRNVRLAPAPAEVEVGHGNAHWRSRITINGAEGEVMLAVKQRVNSVSTPFDFEWRHASGKPWDWKLVRVTNAELALPDYAE